MKKITKVHTTSGALEIRSRMILPEFIIQHIKELVEEMFNYYRRKLVHGNFEGGMVRDNNVYALSIKTRFHESRRLHGILFRANIVLHGVCRRIGRLLAQIGTEIVKATIIFRRTPDPALN